MAEKYWDLKSFHFQIYPNNVRKKPALLDSRVIMEARLRDTPRQAVSASAASLATAGSHSLTKLTGGIEDG